ncbi:MAG: 50S ribosomal protein L23 [Acidobacteria bacterium]|nr:50S ribosomal protein L23 [Acidobacteriota bacterium]
MSEEYRVILHPIITEKSTELKDRDNILCFAVDPRANKIEIKKAVEKLFKVRVEEVRIVNVKGKKKRLGRFEGKRPDWKKAYVKLVKGEKRVEYVEGV